MIRSSQLIRKLACPQGLLIYSPPPPPPCQHSNVEDLLAVKGESVRRINDANMDTFEITPEDIVGKEKLVTLSGDREGGGPGL